MLTLEQTVLQHPTLENREMSIMVLAKPLTTPWFFSEFWKEGPKGIGGSPKAIEQQEQ